MRDSGLAHLLSVSGLHVGLVVGILFFLSRAMLALVPPIALRYPIKKWAAGLALAGAVFYTLLSGASVPVVRACLMAGVALVAVICDRQPISMRLVALAAAVVLLLWPDSLIGPSFQLLLRRHHRPHRHVGGGRSGTAAGIVSLAARPQRDEGHGPDKPDRHPRHRGLRHLSLQSIHGLRGRRQYAGDPHHRLLGDALPHPGAAADALRPGEPGTDSGRLGHRSHFVVRADRRRLARRRLRGARHAAAGHRSGKPGRALALPLAAALALCGARGHRCRLRDGPLRAPARPADRRGWTAGGGDRGGRIAPAFLAAGRSLCRTGVAAPRRSGQVAGLGGGGQG